MISPRNLYSSHLSSLNSKFILCVIFFNRSPIHYLTTREHYSEHLTGRLLHLPGRGLPSQPHLHLVSGGGQRLLQEVKIRHNPAPSFPWAAAMCLHADSWTLFWKIEVRLSVRLAHPVPLSHQTLNLSSWCVFKIFHLTSRSASPHIFLKETELAGLKLACHAYSHCMWTKGRFYFCIICQWHCMRTE